jgi:uncharacterized repeat protein (TIGR01451 family)
VRNIAGLSQGSGGTTLDASASGFYTTSGGQPYYYPTYPTPTPYIYYAPAYTPYPTYPTNLQLSIRKTGKDVTKGELSEQSSLKVSPNDTLEFDIRVRSLSLVTLNNVIIREIMPSGLNYIDRTTSLNGNITSDGITTSGINIGPLAPYQEVLIRLDTLVMPSYYLNGQTTITNVAQASVNSVSPVTAQLVISISSAQVAGTSIAKIAGVATGTTDSLIISLFLGLLATYVYAGYTKTDIFKKKEVLSIVKKFRSDKNRFNFAIQK